MTNKPPDRRFLPDKVRRLRVELETANRQITQMGYVVAGSYRREKSTVGDLDVLVPPTTPIAQAIRDFETWFQYEQIKGGGLKSEGICQYRNAPLLLNLWWVPEWKNWKGLLLFATGPYDLNIMMRAKAKGQGLLLSQYGLFRTDQDIQLDGPPEEYSRLDNPEGDKEIWDLLGLQFLHPVERENWRDRLIRKPTQKSVRVKSSKGDNYYDVTISDGKAVDCECQGFSYRHKCRHLAEAERLYARMQKDS